MSKLICSSAIDGAIAWVARAEGKLDEAVAAKGESCAVGFPGHGLFPAGDLLLHRREDADAGRPAADSQAGQRAVAGPPVGQGVASLPRQHPGRRRGGPVRLRGHRGLQVPHRPKPVDGIWLGAANDVIMRERGIEFVDGTAPGFAAITGAAPTNRDRRPDCQGTPGEESLRLHGRLHERQAVRRAVGRRRRAAWLGHAAGAVRAGCVGPDLCPGLCQPRRPFLRRRQARRLRRQPEIQQEPHLRLRAGPGRSHARQVRRGGRAPSTTASRSSRTRTSRRFCRRACAPTSTSFRNVPYETMVEKALEVRGCKVKITKVPIPVPYGPAFEGERIRKADAHVEFGGNKTTAFEFVTMTDLDADQRRRDRGHRPRH